MDNVPHSTGQAMGMKWITFFYISTIFPNYKRNMHIVEILGNAEKQNKNCSIFWHIWHISMNGLNTIFLVVVCTIVYTYFIEYPVLSVSPKFFKCFFPIAFDKFIKFCPRTSLVGQWIRICLSVQQTQVWSLVWEDPTCHGVTKPGATTTETCSYSLCSTTREAHARQLENAHVKATPGAAKNKNK